MPMIRLTNTAEKAIIRETRPPSKARTNRSRPRLSVPKMCTAFWPS